VNVSKLVKEAVDISDSSYRAGMHAEREKNLKELRRIADFPEMGCRVQLKDFINHLEKKE